MSVNDFWDWYNLLQGYYVINNPDGGARRIFHGLPNPKESLNNRSFWG